MSRLVQLMTPNPISIAHSATVGEASRAMHDCGLRHLPVVDGSNRLVGIISDRDLRGPMVGCLGEVPSLTTSVSAVMTRDVVTAHVDDRVHVAAQKMVDRRVGAVLVIDNDSLIRGIVSYVDVLGHLVAEAAQDARAVDLIDS